MFGRVSCDGSLNPLCYNDRADFLIVVFVLLLNCESVGLFGEGGGA